MNIKNCLVLVLLLIAFTANSAEPSSPYQAFPAGYGYMDKMEIATLNEAVKKGDPKIIRAHGWKLWAGIMQLAQGLDWPIWYTWPNTKAAFAPNNELLSAAKQQIPAPSKAVAQSLLQRNTANIAIPVNISNTPVYPIPQPVAKAYPDAICGSNIICDGGHVLFNGDIMIPTESLSQEAFNWIRDPKLTLYKQTSLNNFHTNGVHQLDAPQRHIVTKHMFWPVKATGLSALPVWHDDFDGKYTGYAGYEKWKELAAVDPSGKLVGKSLPVTYLYGVLQADGKTPWPSVTSNAKVHGLEDFYYHKVSKADWDSFDDADKAIIDAASYWAHNQPFAPGDFLVTVAMHINTKEIQSWALQSVWWTDRPETGEYAEDRPKLPQAKGPWDHYLLTDAYGLPVKPGGNQPIAMNPYIELAIHPVATNCNTCHMRAGWPTGTTAGKASYQNPDCPDTLATLTPNSACLKPLTLTDFQWIIPDRAINQ